LTFLRHIGKNALAIHVIENTDIGIGASSSAIKGADIVIAYENKLQMPNAVEVSTVGNIYGVAK